MDILKKESLIDENTIELRKEEFRAYLKNDSNTIERIMNKYLLFCVPYIYRDNEDVYYELKEEISNYFKIQQTQIYIVGSAKLGFSISPNKRFKNLNEDSDIDIAIIDERLFDKFWKEIYTINIDLISRFHRK